eukprot:6254926-Prymnesium_polylepis.2
MTRSVCGEPRQAQTACAGTSTSSAQRAASTQSYILREGGHQCKAEAQSDELGPGCCAAPVQLGRHHFEECNIAEASRSQCHTVRDPRHALEACVQRDARRNAEGCCRSESETEDAAATS